MRTDDDLDGPTASGVPLPRMPRLRRRKVAIVAAAVLVAGAAWAVIDCHRVCACQTPPVPNMIAFHYAARMAADGDYARARDVFEMLVNDPDSAALRSVALYGRGVNRRALGDAVGGEADIAAATRSEPRVRALYDSFAPRDGAAQVPATR